MWLFVYGSLMWDGWEKNFPCTRRSNAQLAGYARSFDKPSIKNWGSARNPCPTLSLVPASEDQCQGVAFEFPDANRTMIIEFLSAREGAAFEFPNRIVKLVNGTEVQANVPMLRAGSRRLTASVWERAALVGVANGDSGTCYEYVAGVVKSLAELGIEDRAVNEFWAAVSRDKHE